MTLKRSFWDKCRENNKRRIWVWAVSMITHLIMYPGVTLVYMSRIHSRNLSGLYGTKEIYRRMLADAASDALGFHTNDRVVIMLFVLAAVIALQGFGWLHDRQKLDLYKSVPVREQERFMVIYCNSILIWLIPYAVSLVLGLLTAAAYGAVSGMVVGSCIMAFVLNMFYFLVNLNLFILVIMLTGNRIMACLGFAFASVLGEWLYWVGGVLQLTFFDTRCRDFSREELEPSILFEYANGTYSWARKFGSQPAQFISGIAPVLIKWALCAAVLGILAYLCYRKRPAEMAGRTIAYPVIWPFLKGVIVVSGTLFTAYLMYRWSEENTAITFLTLIGAAVLFSCILEAVYEFDIRAVAKHLVSSAASLSVSLVIFCLFWFDVFGYDSYIPDQDQIESAVVAFYDYTQDYWEYTEAEGTDPDPAGTGYETKSRLSPFEYAQEHMYLTDTDAVTALAQKGIEQCWQRKHAKADVSTEKPGSYRYVSILYRLKNGREVSRCYNVDLLDPDMARIIDAVIGTKEYRAGVYMPAATPQCLTDEDTRLYYTNGSMQAEMDPADAAELYQAWDADMEGYDYSFASANDMCGKIMIKNTMGTVTLPVYESFQNTVSLLSDKGAYYPLQPDLADIESLAVTNNNYEETGSAAGYVTNSYAVAEADYAYQDGWYGNRAVTVVYDDPAQIGRIMETAYPDDFYQMWRQKDPDDPSYDYLDENYTITIAFKPDIDYPYKKVQDTFSLKHGQIPDFVKKDTAYRE